MLFQLNHPKWEYLQFIFQEKNPKTQPAFGDLATLLACWSWLALLATSC